MQAIDKEIKRVIITLREVDEKNWVC